MFKEFKCPWCGGVGLWVGGNTFECTAKENNEEGVLSTLHRFDIREEWVVVEEEENYSTKVCYDNGWWRITTKDYPTKKMLKEGIKRYPEMDYNRVKKILKVIKEYKIGSEKIKVYDNR